MALKAKNSDVTHFEKNNFPLLAKNVFSSSFLVILPQFWPPCLTFLGTLRFSIGRPVSPQCPPQLGQNPKFFQKLDLKASLSEGVN